MQICVIELSNWRTTKLRLHGSPEHNTMEARTWIAEIRRHSNVSASARGSVLNINTKVHKTLCFRVWCWAASLVECALNTFLFSVLHPKLTRNAVLSALRLKQSCPVRSFSLERNRKYFDKWIAQNEQFSLSLSSNEALQERKTH